MTIITNIDNLIKIVEEQDIVDKVVDFAKDTAHQVKQYVTTHLAHKPVSSTSHTGVAKHISVHKAANPRNFFKDIEDNTKAKLAAIDADDAARKADISSHKEAFQSRIASQNAAAKTPMVAAYKARFNSASSGNGPVPTQWYKNRPIKTD